MNSQLKTVNEIEKLTGTTVRTLHYYDEINLLKPSDSSQAGWGINFQITVEDVERLYKRLKSNSVKLFRDIIISNYKANDSIINEKEILVQDPDGYLLRFSELIVQK